VDGAEPFAASRSRRELLPAEGVVIWGPREREQDSPRPIAGARNAGGAGGSRLPLPIAGRLGDSTEDFPGPRITARKRGGFGARCAEASPGRAFHPGRDAT